MRAFKSDLGPYGLKVEAYGVGNSPDCWRAGDVILTHSPDGVFGKLIRFGQRLRYRGEDKPFAWFNHAALVVSRSELIEAQGRGIVKSCPDDYEEQWYAYIGTGLDNIERRKVLAYAERVVDLHTKYGWAQIASIGLSLLLGSKVQFGASGQNICSGFVAAALQTGGYWFERDNKIAQAAYVTPADLACAFGTERIRGEN